MNKAYLILGGNMGNRTATIENAVELINVKAGKIVSASSYYETEAWGMENASSFLNKVVEVRTEKNAEQLLEILLEIEKELGRKRNDKNKYESREIDIDILFFNSEIIHTEKLTVPHPRLHERKFALIPMAQINPEFIHPVFKKTISVLLKECSDKCEVKKYLLT